MCICGPCVIWYDAHTQRSSSSSQQRENTVNENTAQENRAAKLRQLKVIHYSAAENKSSSGNSTSCAICLSEYVHNDALTVLPCHSDHMFHKNCIESWIVSNGTCPDCRAPVFADEVADRGSDTRLTNISTAPQDPLRSTNSIIHVVPGQLVYEV
jgi:hypothetical protein